MGLVLIDPWGNDLALRRSVRGNEGNILFDSNNSGTRNLIVYCMEFLGRMQLPLEPEGYIET